MFDPARFNSWLRRCLGGPAAPFLGEENDFGAALAPPLFPAYFPGAAINPPSPTPSADLPEYNFSPGYGPETDAYLDLPMPTPALSDVDLEHFMPPGYGPVSGLESPPPAEEAGAPAAAPFVFDLNVQVEPEDEEAGVPAVAAPFAFDLNVKVEPEDEESSVAAPASPPTPPAQALQPAGPSTPPPEARRILRRFAAAMASRQPGIRPGTWNLASLGFSGEEESGGSSSRRW